MHLMSKARIIGFALILNLAVQGVRSEDWKPEWTGPHAGWLTYKTNSLEIYHRPVALCNCAISRSHSCAVSLGFSVQ
jgi:hypothetical protein